MTENLSCKYFQNCGGCYYDNIKSKDYQNLNFVQYEVGYDENGVSLSQLPGRLPPPNHEFGPVKLTIFK